MSPKFFNILKISGKKLRTAIKTLDLTQEEAANRLNIARQTLSNWFNYDELTDDMIENVKTNLGIDLHRLGKMLNEPEAEYKIKEIKNIQVPIYDIEFSAGVMQDLIDKNDDFFPIGYLGIPEVSGCDAVIRVKGDSMAPKINDRDWIGVKKMDNWNDWLPMGYIYAISTASLQLIKYIKKGSKEDTFTIESHNKKYEDDQIPVKVIKEIWAVKTIIPFSKIETLI